MQCSPWSGGQTVNLCTGVGEELLSSGNMEEVFLHEGCHVSLDFMQEVSGRVCVSLSTPPLGPCLEMCTEYGPNVHIQLCQGQPL